MEIELDQDTLAQLKHLRKKERDVRKHVKLSVVINLARGISPAEVAEFLGIDDGTVYRHLESYKKKGLTEYLKDDRVGYVGRMNEAELKALKEEVHQNLYLTAWEVKQWIAKQFKIEYHEKQVVKILHRLGFVYKKTKLVPGKAKLADQEAYLAEFKTMMAEKEENTVVFFNDGVHPQFNTRSEYGWILKGQEYEVPTQAGRQRLNITGAVNAELATELYAVEGESVNAQSTILLWQQIEQKHSTGKLIHICDNAKYYKSKVIKQWLAQHQRTEVRYLPPYSPNLNPIERVWKLIKKEAINSYWYKNIEEFRRCVMDIFKNPLKLKSKLESLVTLNFRTMGY